VIDPFEDLAQRVETLVRCQKSKVVAVLDTHAHVDHDSCRVALLGALSQFAVNSARTDDLLGWPADADGVCQLDDGSEANWIRLSDELVIAKTGLPGHTRIGVAYLVGTLDGDSFKRDSVQFAFTGDMILTGGIGRTDFPCSSIEMMYDSLQRLPRIIGQQTLLCPTHDYNNDFATTLAAELAGNEYLRSITDSVAPMTLADFESTKPGIDAGINDASNSELVCGLIRNIEVQGCLRLDKGGLKTLLAENPQALIIDVREPLSLALTSHPKTYR